ncbi:MAG: 3'(2'),5'-bisphosphate nucleotidase [bacterium]|nr:3'(2'),5'-bisphosphate nucleotidase [bacterium]
MNTTNLSNLSSLALDAVRVGCRIASSVQQEIVDSASSVEKLDESPVTVADFAVQVAIAQLLADHDSPYPMMAEEDSSVLATADHSRLRTRILDLLSDVGIELTSDELLAVLDRCDHPGGSRGRFWVLDPIDGTKGFLRGHQYAVALSLIEDGQPVLGILGCPNLNPNELEGEPTGCLFLGVRGEGAQVTDLETDEVRSISVCDTRDSSQAVVCRSYESAHSAVGNTARIASDLGIDVPAVGIDSQVKYGILALGIASIYLRLPRRADYREKIWDHAAGALIVEEAGGRVSDVSGAPLNFGEGPLLDRNGGIVVTNGLLHDSVLEATRRVLAST